jgi:2-polyprenyl-3-methyl-5-hydroxy-6-metoxy-1,4-benzoquinol methylase
MGLFSVYDCIYSQREQVLSNFAAGRKTKQTSSRCGSRSMSSSVSLFSWLFLPMRSFSPGRDSERGSSNSVFHFSRIQRGDTLPIAMARHQHVLFSQLYLRPKKTVLALSCGNGAISQQLLQFSDVNVVGIDTDVHLVSIHSTP